MRAGSAAAGTSASYHFALTNEVAIADVITTQTVTDSQTLFIDSFDNGFTENPEPSTFVLMGSALAGLGIFSRRRKKA